jgi:hypothetical protein
MASEDVRGAGKSTTISNVLLGRVQQTAHVARLRLVYF